MKQRIIILLLLLLPTVVIRAQIFDWPFGADPFGSPRQRQVQQYKAPEFKGGKDALNDFLLKNFHNPANASRELNGRIVIACIVNERGRIVETYIVRSVSSELDAEAQRVCKKLKLRPATQQKKKVKGRFDVSFPIRRGRLSFVTLDTTDV